MNLILKLKMYLEETPSTIPKNFNLYKMCQNCLFKRHLLEFQKIIFILKVSLEKTLSTIPQSPICIKNYGNDFKAKDVSLQCMKIVESVSLRDTKEALSV